ncbi:MAG: EscU/YscU/HrcU family type III secretion system export apparatus switch protein [Devosia sp.]|jgi:flagellar biosynthesis protein|uniref:EscU/YscU/HrcU family type III secretion system export apparatus switch protein n=1 Tax=Devosia sp. TaxID=1871048 RepID=UPI0019F78969|nr:MULTISPECIES: EscU/YscU/HrcU family type III secretion system export apparatus switch protein [unclassified Devosia]MBF0678155.1 EscU/YscU/HrcU family type III secretion system export apparatus switch protein [Devosia sp.]WEJ31414.1 EscU/YscU/HrcU family type III secretion system export apparatus switch protein [Devosia sp. SD17-2]
MTDRPPMDHLAVALQYEKGEDSAPRVVAKGRGFVAAQIVALAEANDIVIEANPMLAEALSKIELDDTIPLELYEAVAVIIGFILSQKPR